MTALGSLLLQHRSGFWGGDAGTGDVDVRVVRNGDIQSSGQVRWERLPVRGFARSELKGSQIRAGDLLLTTSGNCGHVALVRGDPRRATCATNFVRLLRPDPDLVEPIYLFHFLNRTSFRAALEPFIRGTAMKNLSVKDLLARSDVPLPSLGEQRRIAEVLDRADALRARRNQSRALFEDLTQSIFLDLFGPARDRRRWPIATLGELLAGIDSGKSPVCLSRPALDAEWGVLKLGAVSRQQYLPEQNKALPGDVEPAVAAEVKAGDLLMARKNTLDLVGACALVESTRPRLLLPDLIFRLRLHDQAPVELRYLHRTLGQDDVRGQIRSLAGGSAGSMPNISKARLSTVRVPIPPLELQKTFDARMERVEQQNDGQSSATDQLDALFASLQQRAFEGKF